MKNLTKKQIHWIIWLLILIVIVGLYVFNVFNIKTKTTNGISQITIPFSLIVNPHNIDKGITPKSINTNPSNISTEKDHVVNLVNNMNTTFKQNKKLFFLSNEQQKQLKAKVNKVDHQYIYGITLVNFGRDHSGKYFTISCNQYNDTKSIKSYRYILHYKKNQITTSKYIGSTSNTYPPKFIFKNIKSGKDGIHDSKQFMQEVRTAIINSGLISNNDVIPGDFNQIGNNIGLDGESSSKALYKFTKQANSRLTNFGITGYELSDVPRKTRIYIKQINNDHNYYYTLAFNRNSSKFTSFKNGIVSNRLTK